MVQVAEVASTSAREVHTDHGTISLITFYAKTVWKYLGELL